MKRHVRNVLVDDVVVPRGRRPLRPVGDLADSIATLGLLNPIVVTADLRLVAGLHRLAACRQLGWRTIPASVADLVKVASDIAALDENLMRHELTVLERAEALLKRKALYEALHPETKRGVAGGKASGAARRGANKPTSVSVVRTVAANLGCSSRTVERQIQIANRIPQDLRRRLSLTWAANDQKALLQLARLAGTEQRAVILNIADGGARTVRIARAASIATGMHVTPVPSGRYAVIVIDPPWPYESSTVDYPVMGLDEIKSLPLASLAADNAVVFVWTTNLMMRRALECVSSWGLSEQTILTWVKNRIGKGWYLRNQTEHCIVAVRGRPTLRLTNQSTVLHARTREAGRKPDEFYALVESLCPGPKLEMFARESRTGGGRRGAAKRPSSIERRRLGRRARRRAATVTSRR